MGGGRSRRAAGGGSSRPVPSSGAPKWSPQAGRRTRRRGSCRCPGHGAKAAAADRDACLLVLVDVDVFGVSVRCPDPFQLPLPAGRELDDLPMRQSTGGRGGWCSGVAPSTDHGCPQIALGPGPAGRHLTCGGSCSGTGGRRVRSCRAWVATVSIGIRPTCTANAASAPTPAIRYLRSARGFSATSGSFTAAVSRFTSLR